MEMIWSRRWLMADQARRPTRDSLRRLMRRWTKFSAWKILPRPRRGLRTSKLGWRVLPEEKRPPWRRLATMATMTPPTRRGPAAPAAARKERRRVVPMDWVSKLERELGERSSDIRALRALMRPGPKEFM